ncbi:MULTISPECIES: hypothetical protein [Staphylococcus]|uniref:hypothetical protein n=1 Tax=Staphylococcus TaxID=1279 RepID=UPI0021CEC4E9|nr:MULTISPECIES: hypothetical protein [Staphylococcus]UXS61021.1 hypothetical protein MUA21_05340 [Staphylococcus ureilyticus]UXU48914.1 hypothetical protein MUA37_07530 [Staphylococcus arlettae]
MNKKEQSIWFDKVMPLAIEMYALETPFQERLTFDDVADAYADNEPLEEVFKLIPKVLYPYIEQADKEIANEYDKNIEDYTPYMN